MNDLFSVIKTIDSSNWCLKHSQFLRRTIDTFGSSARLSLTADAYYTLVGDVSKRKLASLKSVYDLFPLVNAEMYLLDI